ncbi:MAG TPA: hypothetical protein DCM68_03100 [Verrucomicrobia bacterium]|nr:hypothetical protein [Verrucomicrobiota bacterium]
MPFENGSVSFRMLELPRAFPKDFAEKFAAHRAKSLDAVGAGEQRGWVTGRHLLDSHITEDSAMHAGWIRLALRQAERKVPAALLKAECRMEELAVMAAEGKPYLKAKARAEIRQSVTERLLPNMPPQLRAIPFVYMPGSTHLYVTALATSPLDVFNAALAATLGFGGDPSTPETLGATLKKMDLRDLPGASFSPEMESEAMEAAPGREFLTWLWFKAETQNGKMALSEGRDLGVLLEGPLTFTHEGNGAHAAVLKKGAPENSIEAKTCLLSGKKLKEAKITFALDEHHLWSFGFEADQFLIRGLKLPQGEGQLDAISRFQERMIFLEQWREIFLDLFGAFVEVRREARKWKNAVADIREWVKGRPGRR